MSPRWRRTLPADIAALQEHHGKVLAWGRTDTGGIIIATAAALVIDGEPARTLPWDRIDRASWEPPQLRLEFRDPDTGAPERMGLTLAEHGELPPVIHQRVTRSVLKGYQPSWARPLIPSLTTGRSDASPTTATESE